MTPQTERVTRADIEAKLREIGDQVDGAAESARPTLITAGAAASLALSLLAYLLGRRRGRRRSTVVEVRRV